MWRYHYCTRVHRSADASTKSNAIFVTLLSLINIIALWAASSVTEGPPWALAFLPLIVEIASNRRGVGTWQVPFFCYDPRA